MVYEFMVYEFIVYGFMGYGLWFMVYGFIVYGFMVYKNQLINLSTYQLINLSTYQPINLSTYQPSTHQPINPSTHQPINLSTHQPINLSTINLSTIIMIKSYYQKFKAITSDPKYRSLWYVFLFMLITYVFHKLWWMFAAEIKSLAFIRNSAEYLAHQVFVWSDWFNTHILALNYTTKDPNTFLFPQVNGYIAVEESCSGLKQMYQLFFLFVLFPGPWKHKLWYIPMTFFVMYLTNVFRIIVLSVILINIPDYWHFCHDWILRPFFYVVIFTLWVIWVEYFVTKKKSLFLAKFTDFFKSR